MVQSLTSPSDPDDSSCIPAHTNATFSTDPSCPWKLLRHAPSLMDHNFTVASALADATTLSTGENFTHHTPRLCPLHVCFKSPLAASHSLTDRSWEPEATIPSLGEMAMLLMSFSCPAHDRISFSFGTSPPVSSSSLAARFFAAERSQSLMVRSALPDAHIKLFRGATATAPTASTCPSPSPTHRPDARCHTRTSWSLEEVAMRPATALQSTARMMLVWPWRRRHARDSSSKMRRWSELVHTAMVSADANAQSITSSLCPTICFLVLSVAGSWKSSDWSMVTPSSVVEPCVARSCSYAHPCFASSVTRHFPVPTFHRFSAPFSPAVTNSRSRAVASLGSTAAAPLPFFPTGSSASGATSAMPSMVSKIGMECAIFMALRSHTPTTRSRPAVSSDLVGTSMTMAVTALSCPLSTALHVLVASAQTRTSPSSAPEKSSSLLGSVRGVAPKHTLVTIAPCPLRL
mmetsp:Transcript_18893/g.44809  ORF Transcript_18893/g.44809 Transcript_18893/m.44809 type:complete len:461 (+) Transcript_18893:3-1385(+)